ncbi:MAG: ATP-binding protein [Streptosporangiaceae bacterium]
MAHERGDAPLPDDAENPADLARSLRQLKRRQARRNSDTELSYRELAAKSGYAHGVIGDYFTGKVLPPTDRLDVLAGLLGATGPERRLLATARDQIDELRRHPGAQARSIAAARRTLPHDAVAFTGRDAQLRALIAAARPAGEVGLFAIGGMAGVGKTAFAVRAAHQLASQFPDGQIYLPLHGHTPGQRPVQPADALASLLQITGTDPRQLPSGLEARASRWRDWLAAQRLLLVFDDAYGHEQVRPLLPGTPGSLVLVTSRRRLTALENARAISLDVLPPADAAGLFARLADRADLGPGDAHGARICELCGYLPLAIGLLARQLHHHPAWSGQSLAADLAAARDHRLELMHAENISVAAAFELSYDELPAAQQRLFRRLALHAGPEFEAYAAAALSGAGLPAARRGLGALYDHYLLEEAAPGRYRFHDLIREHARALLAGEPAGQRDEAVDRVLGFYLHAACAASTHLARRTPQPPGAAPAALPRLSGREESIAWLAAENANLTAAVRFAARTGRLWPCVTLAAALNGFLLTEGHWEQAISLHRLAVDAARQLADSRAEARALVHLGVVSRLTGHYQEATASFAGALALIRGHVDQPGEAHALNELGVTQYLTGDYPAADRNLRAALDLLHDLGDTMDESGALNDLGLVQLEAGDYDSAAASFARALGMHRELGDQLWEANALNNIGIVARRTGDYDAALDRHRQALELYRALGNRFGEARALSYLGVAQCLTAELGAAEQNQERALALYRALGNQAGEAETLNYLGIVQGLGHRPEEAAASHGAALGLYRALGTELGVAESLNGQGELALACGRPEQAAARHEEALGLVRTNPAERARALEGLGRALLASGQPAPGQARLAEALAVYEAVGSPFAEQLAALVHGLDTAAG